MTAPQDSTYTFHLLTPERWTDFERLFGAHGAYAGCWCMFWFLRGSDFTRGQGDSNRRAMKARVEAGLTPGMLAYLGDEPVGWCAFGPREQYPRLQASRTLKPVDDVPVWSIVCFYVAKEHRKRGVSKALLRAVIEEVRRRGGTLVEGYPSPSTGEGRPDPFVYLGLEAAFREVGFVEVARPTPRRLIMRYSIQSP
jgi:GNAT superfamily N-acetyltransferase